MKKLLIFLLMIVTFGACSKNDDSGSTNSIKKATVKGAQLIYQKSTESKAGTRATADVFQRFMTVDDKGNVKPIRFVTEKGDTLDMRIQGIKNLNNEYLVLKGDFHFNNVYINQLLVNKNTELIYAMAADIDCWQTVPAFEDKNKNIYWGRAYANNAMIYRFNVSNPTNITVENYLPEKQNIYKFWVNKDGICYYSTYMPENDNLKCPGGRIYNIKELLDDKYSKSSVFCGINGIFYIACLQERNEGNLLEIFEIKIINDNSLQAVNIASLSTNFSSTGDFCPNIIRKSNICSDGRTIIEFDETTNELKEHNIVISKTDMYIGWGTHMSSSPNSFVTSESLWVIDGNKLYQLQLSDYSLKEINLVSEGYAISQKNITCSLNAPGLSFSGLRYSDGQNVVGTINEDGTITAFEETKSSNQITTLLRLN